MKRVWVVAAVQIVVVLVLAGIGIYLLSHGYHRR